MTNLESALLLSSSLGILLSLKQCLTKSPSASFYVRNATCIPSSLKRRFFITRDLLTE